MSNQIDVLDVSEITKKKMFPKFKEILSRCKILNNIF